jgi:BASS family bile acid:Na+ symporter
MQQSLALSIGLPAALVIIMFGLGLSLRLQDFIRCFSRPWPLLVGIFCQVVILPLICFALVSVVDMPPSISVGMMLLAASPGGPSAAIYTHLARGDLALSLVLTAVTSVVALFSLPIIANLSFVAFLGKPAPSGSRLTRSCRYSLSPSCRHLSACSSTTATRRWRAVSTSR